MDPEQLFYGRALHRIQMWIVWLSGVGTLAAMAYGGWRWGIGFVLGSGSSYLNLRWLKQLVNSLGVAAAGKPQKARVAVFLGLRYLLLALGGYVIVKFSSLSLVAALIGLFVPVAAVILEILFELAYVGT